MRIAWVLSKEVSISFAGVVSCPSRSWKDVLRLMMAGIAVVLLIYVAAYFVIIEFAYRHLVAAPMGWLMARLKS
jgi:hypothetical protein